MRKIFNNSGASMVVMTISMVTILGMTSLVVDIGLTIHEKEKLSVAADAAALAGMQEIDKDDATVINTAKQYAALNGVDPEQLDITINSDRKNIKVFGDKDVEHFFARAIGVNKSEVGTQSKVKVAPITSVTGVRPLAIANQTLEFNKLYTLKEGAGGSLSGNFGALAFGGNGASVYRDNLLYGYKSEANVGDIVFTETGNITQATTQSVDNLIKQDPKSTFNNFGKDSPRLIIIPIVNTLDVSGKKPIIIVGFASFFLEGTSQSGGQAQVVGRFVKFVTAGDSSDTQTDYGLKAVKLIN